MNYITARSNNFGQKDGNSREPNIVASILMNTVDSNMTVKLIILALSAVVVSVHSQAAKYPAGVDPHLCPNYPHCDNAALGAAANAAGAVAHALPTYEEPSYHRFAIHASPAYGHAPLVPVAEGYPAGVNPHSCPNYPYCGPTPAHVPTKIWAAPSTYGHPAPDYSPYGASAPYAYESPAKGGDRYPAGVDPHSCPNYPYCH